MHPNLFTVPLINYPVKSYGVMVMIGFLTATWFAMRRASRVRANPDLVLDLAFVALIAGLIGARAFYVIHYWESEFASLPNPFLSVVNLGRGGLEFLGGLLGSVPAVLIFLKIKKASARTYLDILAPGLMWGLAFGRLGCFLNGCCFGGTCELPWSVTFPYGSPAFLRQWEERELTLPAELVFTSPNSFSAYPVPAEILFIDPAALAAQEARAADLLKKTQEEVGRLRAELEKAPVDSPEAKNLRKAIDQAVKTANLSVTLEGLPPLRYAQSFPDRDAPAPETGGAESETDDSAGKPFLARTPLPKLAAMAHGLRSHGVHPTQLYSSIHALLLSGVLSGIFYLRRRQGVVFGAMLLAYPIARFLIEEIRTDNPHDVLGFLTISQGVSICLFAVGCLYMLVIWKMMPEIPAISLRAAESEAAAKSQVSAKTP